MLSKYKYTEIINCWQNKKIDDVYKLKTIFNYILVSNNLSPVIVYNELIYRFRKV